MATKKPNPFSKKPGSKPPMKGKKKGGFVPFSKKGY